uniref:uncharacterized protein At5g48480-like n=1 Tax=Erigeron canadensis TaxID=72917 RepID=UPI001CB93DBB|nr:uncharacterized protein At5g48480-like [Erigeron canadensis]
MTTTDSTVAPPSQSAAFTSLKPHLFVQSDKANDAVSFYKSAFGAEEVNRVNHPKRKADQELPLLLTAEIKIGPSSILISDDSAVPVKGVTSTGLVFCMETDNIDAAVEKAVKAGAVTEGEITQGIQGDGACCGGRVAKVKDPYGIVWLFCTPAAKKSADVEA